MEYLWGYSKLPFRTDFNDGVASRLEESVVKLLDESVLMFNIICTLARKAREYKLTYALLFRYEEGGKIRTRRDTI